MVLVGRPGYRIDTVLSRGALDWALAYQLERAQTFAYLPSSSFLVLIWIFSLLGFGACCDLHDKPKFSENGFRMENLLRFRVGNIIGLSVRKVPHLPMCVNLTIVWFLIFPPFVGKLLSLPFQQNWFHLFWSSNEKVIAFQDLPVVLF